MPERASVVGAARQDDWCRRYRRGTSRRRRGAFRRLDPRITITVLSLALIPLFSAATVGIGIQPGHHDLGDVQRSDARSVTVILRNSGSGSIDVSTHFEGTGDAKMQATPATFPLAPDETRSVALTMTIGADAAPGAHEPRFVATAHVPGPGYQALGAVQVLLQYNVAVVDVAYAEVLQNGTAFLRFVNGHGTARLVEAEVRMQNASHGVDTRELEMTMAAGQNHMLYWPIAGTFGNGTYRLWISGTATGGGGSETFDATYDATYDGAAWSTALAAAATPSGGSGSGGGGGGGGESPRATDTPEAPPPSPSGDGAPLVLIFPVPDQEDPVASGEGRGASGGSAPPTAGSASGLPSALETLEDSLTYSLVAVAVALMIGAAVVFGRVRLSGP